MIAYGYQAKAHYHDKKSLFIHNPEPEIGAARNILRMTRPDAKYTDLEAEVLDLCLVLHAEHGGGNNSTFTVHVVTSAATDLYSAIAAGVGSLKGLKHGGANVKVVRMMQNIRDRVDDYLDPAQVEQHLRKIMRREAFDREGLIYGMGHAVYTLSDPRCGILKEKARVLAKAHGYEKEFAFYEIVEEMAPRIVADVKKTSKPICPNVDFYSGFVYQMLNIPSELFTPLFATARVAGWCAHVIEETLAGGRIMRPAFKHVAPPRSYTPMAERTE
jgi:citrate synthase